MKKKQLIALLMAGMLSAGVLAGCGVQAGGNESTASETSSVENTEQEGQQEIAEISDIVYENITLEDGLLTLPVKMIPTITGELNEKTINAENVKLSSISKVDDHNFNVTIKTKAETISEALGENGGFVLTVSADVLDSKQEEAILVLGDYAFFYPEVDFVEEQDDAYKVTMILHVGDEIADSSDNAIDAKNITFTGDFAEAKDLTTSLNEEGCTQLTFTIPRKADAEEKMNFEGTVTVAAGAVRHPWGELMGELNGTAFYTGDMEKSEGAFRYEFSFNSTPNTAFETCTVTVRGLWDENSVGSKAELSLMIRDIFRLVRDINKRHLWDKPIGELVIDTYTFEARGSDFGSELIRLKGILQCFDCKVKILYPTRSLEEIAEQLENGKQLEEMFVYG